MKKKKYEKPKMQTRKLEAYFFACLRNTMQCTSYFGNKNVGSGCPA